MALRGEIVNFVRLNFSDQSGEATRVASIPVMQNQAGFAGVRIGINGIEPPRIERAGPSNDAMHFITFGEQQFREVGAVLSGNASDQCFFHYLGPSQFIVG